MYKYLLIEDSATDAAAFQDTVKRINNEAGKELYNLKVAKAYSDGINMLSSDLNGAIIDIKLDGDHDGNDIIREIIDKYRIPVVVFTGTPDVNQEGNPSIRVYKKGEASHETILKDLGAVSDTGLFNVLGGTGIIEKEMTNVFWNNLFPQIDFWREKKQEGIDTEKVLLRYVISHIQELIDEEMPAYVTEEMYIRPPISSATKTGSIYRSSKDGSFCIVLSPPCDLAIHKDGTYKTNRILICKIEDHDSICQTVIEEQRNKKNKIKAITKIISNNDRPYYHWLPRNTLFVGGYINFRKVETYSPEEFANEYGEPELTVQEVFIKNVLNRFSTYYARQGQPDFNVDAEAKTIYEQIEKSPK